MTSRWKDIEMNFHLELKLPSSDIWLEIYVHLNFPIQDFMALFSLLYFCQLYNS